MRSWEGRRNGGWGQKLYKGHGGLSVSLKEIRPAPQEGEAVLHQHCLMLTSTVDVVVVGGIL